MALLFSSRSRRADFDPMTIAAIAGSVGQVVGTLTNLFGGSTGQSGQLSPDPTDDLTPEVRAWWNSGMGGQWFADWLLSHQPAAFRWSLDQLLPLYYLALVDAGKTPFWGTGDPWDPRLYRPGLTEQAFAAMGIDYAATAERYLSLPPSERTPANVYVFLPGGTKEGGAGSGGGPKKAGASAGGVTGGAPKAATLSLGTWEIVALLVLAYLLLKG